MSRLRSQQFAAMRMLLLGILCCILLPSPVPVGRAQAQTVAPTAKTVPCPDDLQPQLAPGAQLSCGWLQVPESYNTPASQQIELFWMQLTAESKPGNAPLVVLSGGPGDAASAQLAFWQSSLLHHDYDIILLDQRGSGRSQPSLDCPEADSAGWISRCRTRLAASGVNLSAYNSWNIVQDLRAFLSALQLQQVNLYGTSYGSRLAWYLARIAPQNIRAMVLDGVYPPPHNHILDLAENSQQVLEQVFADCAASLRDCQDAEPPFAARLYSAVEVMNAKPLALPGNNAETSAHLDGQGYLLWLLGMLDYPAAIGSLPRIIDQVFEGFAPAIIAFDSAIRQSDEPLPDSHSEGLYFSVTCAEHLALDVAGRWRARYAEVGGALELALSPVAQQSVYDCAAWGVEPKPVVGAPALHDDIPTLLLSGAYDRLTPPRYARIAAASLNRHWHQVFPAAAHGVLEAEACAGELMDAFLQAPLLPPQPACLAGLRPPRFRMQP